MSVLTPETGVSWGSTTHWRAGCRIRSDRVRVAMKHPHGPHDPPR